MVHEGRVSVLADAKGVVAVLPGCVTLGGKRHAIRQDRRVGGNAVGIRGNDRGHRGAVRLALRAGGDGTGSLVGDIRFRQLGGCRVDLAVDERDRDPFTPQAHVAGFAQMVVVKIRLISCCDRVGSAVAPVASARAEAAAPSRRAVLFMRITIGGDPIRRFCVVRVKGLCRKRRSATGGSRSPRAARPQNET